MVDRNTLEVKLEDLPLLNAPPYPCPPPPPPPPPHPYQHLPPNENVTTTTATNSTNNNNDVVIVMPPFGEADNAKIFRDCERDNNNRALDPPNIYIVRPSSNSEVATSRLDVIGGQSPEDNVRRVRKSSNRFLVNFTPLDEDHLKVPASPSTDFSGEKIGDDDVFTSISRTNSLERDSKVDIFHRRLPSYRDVSDDSQASRSSDIKETHSQSVSRISIRSVGENEAGKIAEQGRRFANRQTERLVSKDGTCNINSKNVPRGHNSWSRDIFTTLLDLRWRYIIIVFAAVLVGSWFFFAILWWGISILHGDHLEYRGKIEEFQFFTEFADEILNVTPSSNTTEMFNTTDVASVSTAATGDLVTTNLHCVEGVHNFISALLFSIETQQTIGYGTRYITANCMYGIILLVAQSCTGMVLLALTTGIIHSKVCKPKSRAHTMMFSRFAVVCLRDDEYCLLFRVGDMRRSYLIGTSIRAIVMKAKQGDEKLNPLSQHTLELENDLKDTSPLLIWPVTMVHRINESSPLWNLSLKDLIVAKFEIIVVLEGTIEHTGMTAQFRTSYLPSEILWGHHLAPLLTYQKQNGKYEIDFTLFHNVMPIKLMPECSATVYAGRRENRVVGNNPLGFATGGFKRNGSQSVWSRSSRKKLKLKETKDDQPNSPETQSNGYKSLRLPGTPNSSINRFSKSLLRSLRQERPRSAKS